MRIRPAVGMVLALAWLLPGAAQGAGSSVKETIRQLRAPDPAIRSQAAQAVGKAAMWQLSGLDEEDMAALAAALKDGDAPVRLAVSQAFVLLTHTAQGKAFSRPALAALIAALHDPESGVASGAAIALGHIRDPSARRPLIDAMGDARSPVASAAGAALGHFIDPSSAGELIPVLRHEQARRSVLGMLRRFPGEASIPVLVKALEDQDRELRRGAAFVLEELANAQAEAALLRALKDEDGQVRASAARALGRLGDRAASGPVIGLLQDPDPGVRKAAASALSSVGGPEAVEPLIARLSDADVRWEAVTALARIGDDRAVKPVIALLGNDEMGESLFHVVGHWQGNRALVRGLIEALASPDERVSRRAAQSLIVDNGKVWVLGQEAVGPLLPLLKSRQVEVRRAASFTLRTLGDGRFLDQKARGPLSEASRDEDLQVQQNVAKALELLRITP